MLTTTPTTQSSSSVKNVNVPVLISGAGPTGLFAAILLTKLNIPVRLIERHLEVSSLSKALVIHSRTMEVFAQAGIIDRFLELGSRLSDFHVYFGPKLMSVIPALDTKESHYNYGLFLQQSLTTWGLTEELKELGVQIDRGWELMDTKVIEEKNADGTTTSYVETKIRRAIIGDNIRTTESRILGAVEEDPEEANKRYEVEVVRSEYLIATDGGKSAVRHKLNIPFPGRTLDNNLIIFDGHIDSDVPFDDGITYVSSFLHCLLNMFLHS
jgi:2-polyprenyl-6-methoxyphenol hydroxylase-like FAD-dependent oxidoreductase